MLSYFFFAWLFLNTFYFYLFWCYYYRCCRCWSLMNENKLTVCVCLRYFFVWMAPVIFDSVHCAGKKRKSCCVKTWWQTKARFTRFFSNKYKKCHLSAGIGPSRVLILKLNYILCHFFSKKIQTRKRQAKFHIFLSFDKKRHSKR